MKTALALAVTAVATPAFAHSGPHLHPHGQEIVWGLAIVATLAAAGLALRYRR